MVHLTRILFKRNVYRRMKDQFKKKGEYNMDSRAMDVKQILAERNVNIISADEILGRSRVVWEKPDYLLPDYRNQVPVDDNLVPIGVKPKNFICKPDVNFTKGVKQACMLTNTVSFEGLPPFVELLEDQFCIKDQEAMVQKAILDSQVWNSTRKVLPRRHDERDIFRVKEVIVKREVGIPKAKSAKIILDSFLQQCGSLIKDFPMAVNRRLVYRPEMQAVYQWKDYNIEITGLNECLLLSDRSLPLFADSEKIKETMGQVLPNMDPVLPTIDLAPVRDLTMKGENQGALINPVMVPQTVFRIINNDDGPERTQAYNLLNTYGIAIADAQQRYQMTEGDLPAPLCLQNVNISFNRLNFIFLQLNTLDTHGEEGVKNMAWFHSEEIFSKYDCKPWENERYRHDPPTYGNFNSKAFSKFLATYLYGVA